MTRKAQDDEERRALDAFLGAVGQQDWIPLVERVSDPPDFVVHLPSEPPPSRRIGIEVTEFHAAATSPDGRALRAMEENWLRIVTTINQARKDRGDLRNVLALLFFKKMRVPDRRKASEFVRQLVDFVASVQPQLTDQFQSFHIFPDQATLLHKHLERVQVRTTRVFCSWVSGVLCGFVGLSQEELLTCVSRKVRSARPPELQQYWLLLVSDSTPGCSTGMGLVFIDELNGYDRLNHGLKGSPFDRVFIFRAAFGEVFEWDREVGWSEKRSGW